MYIGWNSWILSTRWLFVVYQLLDWVVKDPNMYVFMKIESIRDRPYEKCENLLVIAAGEMWKFPYVHICFYFAVMLWRASRKVSSTSSIVEISKICSNFLTFPLKSFNDKLIWLQRNDMEHWRSNICSEANFCLLNVFWTFEIQTLMDNISYFWKLTPIQQLLENRSTTLH